MTADVLTRITLTDVAHGGYAVGRHDGMVLFVTGGLPGEVVDVQIDAKRSRLAYGRVLSVHEPSPDRREHIWDQAADDGVGGADLGHVELSAGRRWKERVLADQLRRIAHIDYSPIVIPAPGDEERNGLAWRTRCEFAVDQAGRLCMRKGSTHDLVEIRSMPLADAEIQRAAMWENSWQPGTTVSIVDSDRGLTTMVNGAVVSKRGERIRRAIPLRYHLDEPAVSFLVTPGGFWQVHQQAPQVLTTAVLKALGSTVHQGATVWDLYAGAGLFSVPLAQRVGPTGRVLSVESNSRASRDASRNLRGTAQAQALRARVNARTISELGKVDAVVLDPPRSGAGKETIQAITSAGPQRIVYVACDPAALARDLMLATSQGYELSDLRGFDLFPYTHHVEALAVLERSAGHS